MNRFFKSAAFVAVLLAAAFTACEDQGVSPDRDAAGKAAAIIDLGIPGGTDDVDAYGNVTVNRNLMLTSGNIYILHNYFRIQSGYTITIQPGVVIRRGVARGASAANDRAPGTLVIERGAKINAIGDKVAPVDSAIVFTSNKSTPAPGDWGGVIVPGRAPVSVPGGVTTVQGLGIPNSTGFYVDSRFRSGVLIRSGSELTLFNSIITGYKNFQLEVSPASTFSSPVIVQGTTLVAPAFNSLGGVLTNIASFTASAGNITRVADEVGTEDALTLPVLTGLNPNAWNPAARNFTATVEQSAVSNTLLSGLTVVDFRGAFGNFSDANNANWFIATPWVAFS